MLSIALAQNAIALVNVATCDANRPRATMLLAEAAVHTAHAAVRRHLQLHVMIVIIQTFSFRIHPVTIVSSFLNHSCL